MAEASLKLGAGSWATKEGFLLGYNDENDNYKPIPFDFSRASIGTRVNRDGLIEVVQDNIPRIDFTGDGSLLLEPQRTNSLPYSEDFSKSSWTKTNVSITGNSIASPEGIINAAKITENTSGLNLYAPSDTLSGSASAYTYSVFLKEGSLRYGGLRAINNGFANRFFVNVDLQEGTITDTKTVGSGVTWTYGIDSFSDGWYRVWISGTNTSGNIDIAIGLSNSATPTYASGLPYYIGTGSDYIYAWGAQLEEGSYPTSYIPTSGSAVTRVQDDMDTTFSSPLATNGSATIFFHDLGVPDSDDISTTGGAYRYQKDSSNYVSLTTHPSTWRVRVQSGGNSNFQTLSFDYLKTDPIKIAVVVTSTTYSVYANGNAVIENESLSATADFSSIDGFTTIIAENVGVRKAVQHLVFPTALTDSECIDLTTI
jgi:hypothetical protein